jgi:hypothetical protein
MVEGVDRLKRLFAQVPERIKDGVRQELEAAAREMVAQMNAIKPIPEIKIGWTWGAPPSGAMPVGKVSAGGKIAISIYAVSATAEAGGQTGSRLTGIPTWFEFGTAERFQKNGKSTGSIQASPYFFPTYRANKGRVRSRISRRITKEIKALNGG